MNVPPSQPDQEQIQAVHNDDDDVSFGDLSTFDEILSAIYAIPKREIPAVSGLKIQKSFRKPSSSTPTNATPSIQPPPVQVPINILGSISTLLNHPFANLAADGEAKQSLIKTISSLSKAALPSSVQPLYQSLYRFMENLLEQVPSLTLSRLHFPIFHSN